MGRRQRRLALVVALAVVAGAGIAAMVAPAPFGRTPGHGFAHVNCPPGSHGKPLTDGVGQRLQAARDGATAARSLEQRALTQWR
jgi:hypothetical protein